MQYGATHCESGTYRVLPSIFFKCTARLVHDWIRGVSNDCSNISSVKFTEQQLFSYIAILEERCSVATKAKEVARAKVDLLEGLVKQNVSANAELAKAQLALDEANLKLAEAVRRKESYKSVADELKLTAHQPAAFLNEKHVELAFNSGKASLDIDTGRTKGPRSNLTNQAMRGNPFC